MKKINLIILAVLCVAVVGVIIGILVNREKRAQIATDIYPTESAAAALLAKNSITPASVTLRWWQDSCHIFSDSGADLGKVTTNPSKADCHSIRAVASGTPTKTTGAPTPVPTVIVFEYADGVCKVWRNNDNGTRDYFGTVNLSISDCRSIKAAPVPIEKTKAPSKVTLPPVKQN